LTTLADLLAKKKQGNPLAAQLSQRPTDLRGLMQQQYPALADVPFGLVNTPDDEIGYMLESWPVGEPGADDYKRPEGLPIDQFGVQIFDQNTTPRDVAADLVSHKLVYDDPAISKDYSAFEQSFSNPEMMERLKQDYAHAQQNEGETRPLAEWAKTSRIPAYFRGYVFDQWPGSGEIYNKEQKAALDRIKARVNARRK